MKLELTPVNYWLNMLCECFLFWLKKRGTPRKRIICENTILPNERSLPVKACTNLILMHLRLQPIRGVRQRNQISVDVEIFFGQHVDNPILFSIYVVELDWSEPTDRVNAPLNDVVIVATQVKFSSQKVNCSFGVTFNNKLLDAQTRSYTRPLEHTPSLRLPYRAIVDLWHKTSFPTAVVASQHIATTSDLAN